MRLSSLTPVRLAAIVAVAAVPSIALGYGVFVHNVIVSESLGGYRSPIAIPITTTYLPGVADADLDRFRAWFYSRASAISDTASRAAFLRRYPTAAAFNARAFKEFLMLNPEARVLGIDSFAAVYRARTPAHRALDPHPSYRPGERILLQTALQMGAVYVDLDRRNQDRLFRGPDGRVQVTARGDTVPFDPMTLNMGRLTGLSSQAHAHIGLNQLPKSSRPQILKTQPWNFVTAPGFPDSVEAYAAHNAQLYTDLSFLAALEGGPGLRTLSAIFAGSAMHYMSDVGDATHTLQAGIYEFHSDATMQLWVRRFRTGFGLFGRVPSRNDLAIDILTNIHTFSEKLFQVELANALRLDQAGHADSIPASMRDALRSLRDGDRAFRTALAGMIFHHRQRSDFPEFGALLTQAIIDNSYREGADIYRMARIMAADRLRAGKVVVDFDTVPDARVWDYLRDRSLRSVQLALDSFNVLQNKGLARVHEAVLISWESYLLNGRTAPGARPRAINTLLERVVARQVNYLSGAEARRQRWIQMHGGPG